MICQIHRFIQIALTIQITSLIASLLFPHPTIAQDEIPSSEIVPPFAEKVINCMATATPDSIEWGHRYTYWLSGVAEFDTSGNLLPISNRHARDWILTITNSRFTPLETHHALPVREGSTIPDFSFPAVSLQEWNDLGQQTTSEYASVLFAGEVAYGLYMGIRNTVTDESPRQLFQVIHYLDDDYAMVSTVSSCFIGPRVVPLTNENRGM